MRIMFSSDDFKTYQWGVELKKYNCEVVHVEKGGLKILRPILQYVRTILKKLFERKRVHVFIFRYLNDDKSLKLSLKLFLRDLLTIIVCKVTRIRIIWLMHNIDNETIQYYPFLSRLRRNLVRRASGRILVPDPLLIDFANDYGIENHKLDWTCFGTLQKGDPDQRNIELRRQIINFKNCIYKQGVKNICTGICVTSPAKKKAHYLLADSIVGICKERRDSCVALVIIGNYPKGEEFNLAKERALASPYILLIEESFPVNEAFIADQVDFFYRSLTDHSIPYTLYVACDVKRPMITHNLGALSVIIENEKIGSTIPDGEGDIPGYIVNSIESWDPNSSVNFLAKRTWSIGSKRIYNTIQNSRR